MMFLFLMMACDEEPAGDSGITNDSGKVVDDSGTDDSGGETVDPASNLCGTILNPDAGPPAVGVSVLSVRAGRQPCAPDSGGAWWDAEIASPEIVGGRHFDGEVPLGDYGVEVYTNGDYGGCEPASISDTVTCATEVEITLHESVSVDKPNVYLYPTETRDIGVKIPAWRSITESDPCYPIEGWQVKAAPDGLLQTDMGPKDFLFYELNYDVKRFQKETGWCVPGRHAQASIEDAMADMGFLDNEIGDFQEAWDASFPVARWMTVYPQVEDLSLLVVDPAPEHFLRAWFVVTEGCRDVAPAILPQVERTGYHAAEWGVAFEEPLDRPSIIVDGWR